MAKTLIQDTKYFDHLKVNSQVHYPAQPELWQSGGHRLIAADTFDVEYFGRGTVRIETGHKIIPTLAVKIYVTGRTLQNTSVWTTKKIRVQFEFLKDGEPSDFTGGYVYLFYDNK